MYSFKNDNNNEPNEKYVYSEDGTDVKVQSTESKKQKPVLLIWAYVIGLLISPLTGIILSIIGAVRYKNPKFKKASIIGIGVIIFTTTIYLILAFTVFYEEYIIGLEIIEKFFRRLFRWLFGWL